MKQSDSSAKLRLVRNPARLAITPELIPTIGLQASLFPLRKSRLLIICDLTRAKGQEFLAALDIAKPEYVFDTRFFARFDVGGLTREAALKAFAQSNTSYVDISGNSLPGTVSAEDMAARVLSWLKQRLNKVNSRGCLMLLVDHTIDERHLSSILTAQLRGPSGKPWEILQIPCFTL